MSRRRRLRSCSAWRHSDRRKEAGQCVADPVSLRNLCSWHNRGMRIDAVLRRNPALDLTLVAGPWDARIVERVSVIDDSARIAPARRGELVVLTRRASRSASGRGLIQLLEAAGEHELAALALYGRATTSQAVIAAASGARVALLAIGIGEDPAALALALEAALHADADAVLRRLTAALSAIEHA